MKQAQIKQKSFVVAASIAGELHKAVKVAEEISLASSNASVLAMRAGSSAAGFRALSGFVEEVARKTIYASSNINKQAVSLSKLASNSVNVEMASNKFKTVIEKSTESRFADSLNESSNTIDQHKIRQEKDYKDKVKKLERELKDLQRELDVAKVLASMAKVEASQATREHKAQLNSNAESIAASVEKIELHINASLKLIQ